MAKGFKRPVYRLIFEGQLEGFEATMRGASLGEVVRVQTILGKGSWVLTEEGTEDRKEFEKLIGSRLISWNLTEDVEEGKDADSDPIMIERPVPATAEQLAQEDWSLVIALARAWIDAGVKPSGPLAQGSSDGVPSVVESIPMEILSESQLN